MDENFTLNNTYSELIMDLIKNPINKGTLVDADIKIKAGNPYCGDEITIFLKVNESKIIEMKYESKGCAISNASASLLSEKIKNAKIEDVLKLTQEDMFNMFGAKLLSRIKCVTLSLKAVQGGLQKYLKTKKKIDDEITI